LLLKLHLSRLYQIFLQQYPKIYFNFKYFFCNKSKKLFKYQKTVSLSKTLGLNKERKFTTTYINNCVNITKLYNNIKILSQYQEIVMKYQNLESVLTIFNAISIFSDNIKKIRTISNFLRQFQKLCQYKNNYSNIENLGQYQIVFLNNTKNITSMSNTIFRLSKSNLK
jgi:hypothetical protein